MSTSDTELKQSVHRSLIWSLVIAFVISLFAALLTACVDLAAGAHVMESLKSAWGTFYEVATLCMLVLTVFWAVRMAIIFKS
ncbi:hypothetical protein ACGF4C_07010 [Streptomyces sp. NPDC048197]|uniref:hypothetical protein n=1 Tax=Streptomyces sp. NPDC048197 TaxID=3365511 RepID=UPI00371A6D3F